MVFDNNLYYQNGLYRTPYMLPMFSHNHLIMKKRAADFRNKGDLLSKIPLSAPEGSPVEHLIPFLTFLNGIRCL